MSVTVVCHRGWWTKPEEQNTLAAFARAFDAGLGVELDVRDHCGKLVVSHDPVADEFALPLEFETVLAELGDRSSTLAVNVKSCGLAPWFARIKPKPKNWFFFDVPVPEMTQYIRLGVPYYVRWSPQESPPVGQLLNSATGVWCDHGDCFRGTTLSPNVITAFVSPEVHGRETARPWFWAALAATGMDFAICTDKVTEATEFFARG